MQKPYLGNPVYTEAVLRSHGISARKRFGQNFLIDEEVLEATVAAAGVCADDAVLEIGPGIGTLTQYLAYHARKVCAVEIDRNLLPVLEDTLSAYKNVEIINADILKVDIADIAARENDSRPIRVVANLPYYITTPIVMKLLESSAPIKSITVMVQKEVAERMNAEPGTKAYGALTLAVQYYARPEIVRIVHPDSFLPQPDVESAVVHLEKYQNPPVSACDPALMFAVIRAAFNERRKKLANGLANDAGLACTKEEAERALAAAGLPADIRGERLSLAEFARLADALSDADPGQ